MRNYVKIIMVFIRGQRGVLLSGHPAVTTIRGHSPPSSCWPLATSHTFSIIFLKFSFLLYRSLVAPSAPLDLVSCALRLLKRTDEQTRLLQMRVWFESFEKNNRRSSGGTLWQKFDFIDLWHLTFYIWFLTFDIFHFTYDFWHLTFNQWTNKRRDQWTNGPMDQWVLGHWFPRTSVP